LFKTFSIPTGHHVIKLKTTIIYGISVILHHGWC